MRFNCEPGAEVGGVFSNGEAWHVDFGTSGSVEVKDEAISAALEALAANPDSPISVSKGKK